MRFVAFSKGFLGCLLVAGALLLCLVKCHGASATLLWEPSPDSRAAGYVIYYGHVGSNTVSRLDVGSTTNAAVPNLHPGWTYFFYVTAYDQACNESDPSNVIDWLCPSNTCTITIRQADEVTGPWFQRFSSPFNSTNRYYLTSFDLITPPGAVVSILRVNGVEWWRETAVVPRRFYKIEVNQ